MPAQQLEAPCGLAGFNDLPHLVVPMGYVWDVDRTIINTPEANELYFELSKGFGIDPAELARAQAQTEQDGGSFDPLRYTESTLGAFEFDLLGQAFMDAAVPDFTYPDAQAKLAEIEGGFFVSAALTYGVNYLWQGMKTAKSFFRGYVGILPHSRKGPHLANWRSPRGTYDFVGLDAAGDPMLLVHAQGLTLVDDKVASHHDLPPGCDGRLVVRQDEPRLKSQGDPANAPEKVSVVSSLSEIALNGSVEVADCNVAMVPDRPRPVAFKPYVSELRRPSGLIVGQTAAFAALRAQTAQLQAA